MKRCVKCGKVLKEHFGEESFITVFGEERCSDCYEDYLMTDKGKVEYFVEIVRGNSSISNFDADFLGWISVCWTKYRDELAMTLAEIHAIEEKAINLGIL